ncbi:hypothetical protein SNOG_07949 [Parastagonospora nodorum SN15]|uniref:Uncharacterized protein n=1 Tax=Phaeosphaeria nodorum (strain SN15 / ATCC MYA-4574 / FGSC 10173) TaxID=321614 RepID=Q0UJW5_PHANO|nr:hypothetical protein SNOG_07949 [Parastagonospora nodorum SN15]EAT84225.1 hypothetical protein SNOG_07949 [Parastagonospora nodorum SN15]
MDIAFGLHHCLDGKIHRMLREGQAQDAFPVRLKGH